MPRDQYRILPSQSRFFRCRLGMPDGMHLAKHNRQETLKKRWAKSLAGAKIVELKSGQCRKYTSGSPHRFTSCTMQTLSEDLEAVRGQCPSLRRGTQVSSSRIAFLAPSCRYRGFPSYHETSMALSGTYAPRSLGTCRRRTTGQTTGVTELTEEGLLG